VYLFVFMFIIILSRVFAAENAKRPGRDMCPGQFVGGSLSR
jgi:hypothetical protein